MRGIYKIVCLTSGAVYIGSTTVSFIKRFRKHRQRLRHNYHENEYLQYAWNKYGEADFEFQEFEVIDDESTIKAREQLWLDHFIGLGRDKCFNLSVHAAGGNTSITPEQKDKHSKAVKASYTPELIAKRSLQMQTAPIRVAGIHKTANWKTNHKLGVQALVKTESWQKSMKEANKHRQVRVGTNLGESFESVSEATRLTGAGRSNIRASINGKIKSCLGRTWHYE